MADYLTVCVGNQGRRQRPQLAKAGANWQWIDAQWAGAFKEMSLQPIRVYGRGPLHRAGLAGGSRRPPGFLLQLGGRALDRLVDGVETGAKFRLGADVEPQPHDVERLRPGLVAQPLR